MPSSPDVQFERFCRTGSSRELRVRADQSIRKVHDSRVPQRGPTPSLGRPEPDHVQRWARPGDADVRVVIEVGKLRTCGLVGDIVVDSDGEFVESFQGRIVEFGSKVMLEVKVEGFAEAWIGPWIAEPGDKHVVIRIKKPGTLESRPLPAGPPSST